MFPNKLYYADIDLPVSMNEYSRNAKPVHDSKYILEVFEVSKFFAILDVDPEVAEIVTGTPIVGGFD